jgi:hypothetical protein
MYGSGSFVAPAALFVAGAAESAARPVPAQSVHTRHNTTAGHFTVKILDFNTPQT